MDRPPRLEACEERGQTAAMDTTACEALTSDCTTTRVRWAHVRLGDGHTGEIGPQDHENTRKHKTNRKTFEALEALCWIRRRKSE